MQITEAVQATTCIPKQAFSWGEKKNSNTVLLDAPKQRHSACLVTKRSYFLIELNKIMCLKTYSWEVKILCSYCQSSSNNYLLKGKIRTYYTSCLQKTFCWICWIGHDLKRHNFLYNIPLRFSKTMSWVDFKALQNSTVSICT